MTTRQAAHPPTDVDVQGLLKTSNLSRIHYFSILLLSPPLALLHDSYLPFSHAATSLSSSSSARVPTLSVSALLFAAWAGVALLTRMLLAAQKGDVRRTGGLRTLR
ncbi:hypothetical protein FKP32DRAFT_48891 [Trametes sanguinea]|nr:hypothetical protein FKP32DRAFT_48891 [Trametes sanguinea]